MAKIVVSLSDVTLEAIERGRKVHEETRSAFVRRVVEKHLKTESEAQKEARYIQGYLDCPEDAEEMEAWVLASLPVMVEYPWDDQPGQ
ncbi:MAG: hypothetical protein QGG34_17005 [SAR202 cluster bacterium]|nr:hypothetical protein [SAR202 cluster bacterium]